MTASENYVTLKERLWNLVVRQVSVLLISDSKKIGEFSKLYDYVTCEQRLKMRKYHKNMYS